MSLSITIFYVIPAQAGNQRPLIASLSITIFYVIPAQAGNQRHDLDPRLRGNDGEPQFQVGEPQFQALTKH